MNPKEFKDSLYESTSINKNKIYHYNKNIQSKLLSRTREFYETQSKLRRRKFNKIVDHKFNKIIDYKFNKKVDHEHNRSRGLFFSSSFSFLPSPSRATRRRPCSRGRCSPFPLRAPFRSARPTIRSRRRSAAGRRTTCATCKPRSARPRRTTGSRRCGCA